VTPLRIGIDARELLGHATGVGRYLGELLIRWLARPDARRRQFLLYSPEKVPGTFPGKVPGTFEERVVGNGRGTWWEQTALRRAVIADAPDVFFGPAYTAPVGLPMPFAATIHDISFVAHPEWYRFREGLRRRLLTRYAAAHAAAVFTDSEFSAAEIETRLAIPRAKIFVIPPGITKKVPGTFSGKVPGTFPVVLFAGSLFNRRRLPELIAAFARATRDLPDTRLVIVGEDRTWPPQRLEAVADARGVADRTTFLSYAPEAELAALYANARVFAFLSEYEGFGLTPLEALSAGVPILVLDTPVAREVYGPAATYVPIDDARATAAELRRLLLDPGSAAPQMAAAPDVLARYSWDRAASETLAHLERMAGRTT
jgi:glycosyltransferase involved in cell wall biosynthesis